VVKARCFCKTAGAGVEADRRALNFHGRYGVNREVTGVVRLCQVGQRQTVLEWCLVFRWKEDRRRTWGNVATRRRGLSRTARNRGISVCSERYGESVTEKKIVNG